MAGSNGGEKRPHPELIRGGLIDLTDFSRRIEILERERNALQAANYRALRDVAVRNRRIEDLEAEIDRLEEASYARRDILSRDNESHLQAICAVGQCPPMCRVGHQSDPSCQELARLAELRIAARAGAA